MIDTTQVLIEVGSTAIGLISTVAVLKADIRNLVGWVKRIDDKLDETSALAQELKGKVEVLPFKMVSGSSN